MIEFRELQLVMALAKEGSFNKAAETLNMSQPALTKKIARLEDRLGIILFHRSRRGTTPTVFGTHLLKEGQLLLNKGELLQRQMMLMANMELGELRIGVGPVVEQNLLSGVLSRFLARHPRISIDVRVDTASRLLIDLQTARLDLAVGAFSPGQELGDLISTPLADQQLTFAARPDHPLLAEEMAHSKISISQLLRYPFAAPGIPDYIKNWFSSTQTNGEVPLTWGVKCENYNVLREVVKATDHVTGGPAYLFQEDFTSGALCPLPLETSAWLKTSVLTRQEARHAPAVRLLTEIFEQVSRTLPVSPAS